MRDIWIRLTTPDDIDAICALNDQAFGGGSESAIVTTLTAAGDSLLSLAAHNDREILGHLQFFPIQIDGVSRAVGLGPVCVHPDHQKTGIGSGLIRFGLTMLEGAGHSLVFVLGHEQYYSKFGFSADIATPFEAPWSGPAFMAKRFGEAGPDAGVLTYPKAFQA